jgi:hypothetical protein
MNMFRDLGIAALTGLGVALLLTDPTTWTWISLLGPYIAPQVAQALQFMQDIRPFASIFCYALALALFMTRIKF